MNDIEIQRSVKLKRITEIAKNLGIDEDNIEQYGKYKAKIENSVYKNLKDKKDGKLILVTAISPTPLGEGKTTMSIGLADALRKINKKSILALREPSLGPVFGLKGGATGGGYAQIAPMEDINLHFTGDLHAITSANNLLAALIDNHIYFGNKLGIKKVVWKRCLDLNDRQLRKIECGLSEEKNVIPRIDSFDITSASEIMAIFCLATDIRDLEKRIGNILIGYNEKEEPVYARDLNAQGSLTVLLKDAIKPNLVQTLEGTPAIVHGGPFANIAHGCNSIIATKLALKLGDYIITEAGFGADLGAEKFLDIKSRLNNLKPNVAVCVASIKAIKYHGGASLKDIKQENLDALAKGMTNVFKHIENLRSKFGLNVVVAINKFNDDLDSEINYLSKEFEKQNVEFSLVEAWGKGSNGAIDLANKVVKLSENECTLNYSYNLDDDIKTKIEKVCKNIYGAEGVEYSKESLEDIHKIEKLGFSKLPICIAKTQYSFSDDPNNLEENEPFKIHIREVYIKSGARFIVILAGKIYTMPGLPRIPAAENIYLDEKENIVGIF